MFSAWIKGKSRRKVFLSKCLREKRWCIDKITHLEYRLWYLSIRPRFSFNVKALHQRLSAAP